MIDVHAHMCWKSYKKDMDRIMARCRMELSGVVASSARYLEGLEVLSLAESNPGFIFPSLGYHPTEGTEFLKTLDLIKENAGRIVSVGEVGLDHHWEKDERKREEQKRRFSEFIRLAHEIKKPLVLHSWDAERECFEMVGDSEEPVVFHCFSGGRDLAKEIVARGFYISVSTMVLFSKGVRKIARDTPLESMLLETDSPFLPPDREKDPRNYPWNIKLSAGKIAELKKTTKERVLEAAEENASRVFDLKIK